VSRLLEKGTFKLNLEKKTGVMGILNITPDSFSDGGKFFDFKSAVEHGIAMFNAGADIIDIGGESTRPGSDPVSEEEELRRVIPVIEKLSAQSIPVSIDTYKSSVAEAGVIAGAVMINDISGLRFDDKMGFIAAKHDVLLTIMHIKGKPRDMQNDTSYYDLVGDVKQYLYESAELALKSGVKHDRIIIDPGIGFGKSYQQNLEIINRLKEFKALGFPILLGPSRKAFIGAVLDKVSAERMQGTTAACCMAAAYGADILRVHDVEEISQALRMTDYITGKMNLDEGR